MAVQEALILLLLRSADFTVVQIHSLSLKPVCVRVACLLSPPLSLILFSALALPALPSTFSSSPPTEKKKVGFQPFLGTQKGFCFSLPSSLACCFFFLLPTRAAPCSLLLPYVLSQAETSTANSALWQAGRHKMKAQSSKMHQHEY